MFSFKYNKPNTPQLYAANSTINSTASASRHGIAHHLL